MRDHDIGSEGHHPRHQPPASRVPRSRGPAWRAATVLALAALTILATACSGGSGSNDAATTTTAAPGAELQGTWSVDLTLDPTAENDPGDADSVLDTYHETWVFTRTADGCEPGDAGCLLNTRDDGGGGRRRGGRRRPDRLRDRQDRAA